MEPFPLHIESTTLSVRGWGVAGFEGGIIWVQDTSMEGKSIQEIRVNKTRLEGVLVDVEGLAGGSYSITPYDTWQGVFFDPFEIECQDGQPCTIPLPGFVDDMAFRIIRN